MPPLPAAAGPDRQRRYFKAGALAALSIAVAAVVARRDDLKRLLHKKELRTCHPDIIHLQKNNQEVTLIGTLPLDLDGESTKLVKNVLQTQHPDLVMVEGTPHASVSALMMSGSWTMSGLRAPKDLNWTDLHDASPVQIRVEGQPRKKGLLGLFSGSANPPSQMSLVPVKVGYWAYHLRGSVGRDLATAVSTAAAQGMQVRFLGPDDGGFQGHLQVSMLASQAARELLEEEQQKGQMSTEAMNEALRRAEVHVRQDSSKWLKDPRAETARLMDLLQTKVPPEIVAKITERLEERTSNLANGIIEAMEGWQHGTVILAVDQLVGVEEKLQEAGYRFVSQCA